MDKAHQRRFEILAVAILLTLWGGFGLLGDRSGYADALYWPDYTIREVPPGSVLEESGFLPGDSVVSVEGIPAGQLGMYSRWPRSLSRRPGETLQMTVERDGGLVERTVVYRERPPGVTVSRWATALFAQAFLWLGIWVLFTTPSAHASRLAMLGLVAGLALPGPGLGSLNGVRDHLQVAAEVLFLILLLHFFLLFPRTKRPARSRWIGLLYLPWVALLGTLVVEFVMHPRLYHAFGGLIGILLLGYLLAAIVAVVHSAIILRKDLAATGMGLVLAGWAVAVVPNLVAVAGWYIPPGWDTPGQRYFPFLLVAIPVGMALGVRTEAQTKTVVETPGA